MVYPLTNIEIMSLFMKYLLCFRFSWLLVMILILDSRKHVFYIFLLLFSLSPSPSLAFFLWIFINMTTVLLRLRNPTELSLLTSTRTYKGWDDDVWNACVEWELQKSNWVCATTSHTHTLTHVYYVHGFSSDL